VKVTVQAGKRFQNLVLQPRDAATFCGGLRRQVLAEVQSILTAPWPDGAPGVVLLTAAAARLPGLAAALQASLPTWGASAGRKAKTSFSTLEDFGSNLLDDSAEEAGSLVILSPDAAARGAHSVAAFFRRGDIALGHLNAAAPLPLPQPLEAGPARLHHQGQDYLLGAASFVIGR